MPHALEGIGERQGPGVDGVGGMGNNARLARPAPEPVGDQQHETGSNDVYAIIADGSHQYKVEEGQVLEVHLKDLAEDAEAVEFDRVLMVGGSDGAPRIGQPTVEGAKVVASVVGEVKGDKLVIQKFRRRKSSATKTGHRQRYLRVKIEKIEV